MKPARLLYHPPTKSGLVLPPYLPDIKGTFLSGEGRQITSYHLVIAHPFDYVKTVWKERTAGCLDLKWFVFNTMQYPQSRWLSNTDSVIRMEHLTKDLADIGIEGTTLYSPPEKTMCTTTRAYIRKLYRVDFELGEYD